jgi:hypothetical protein
MDVLDLLASGMTGSGGGGDSAIAFSTPWGFVDYVSLSAVL